MSRLRYFVAARAISLLGDRVADIVLPLAILAASRSPLLAGLVSAAVQLPQVLVALPVGAVVDRRERRGLMVGADVVRAVGFAGLGVAIVLGARPVPMLGLALLTGLGDAVFNAAANSHLPAIAAGRDLLRANGAVEASDAAATLTGPAVGGAVLQWFGPLAAILGNAASFLVSAVILWRLPRSNPEPSAVSVMAGVLLLLRDRQQLALLAGACYLHVLAAAAFLPLLVRARIGLGLGAGVIGLIVSAAGIGGLVSSLVLSRFVRIDRWPLLLAATLAVNAAGVGALGLVDAPLWLGVAVLVLDGASALAFVLVAAIRQEITPDRLRGRAFAAGAAITATVRMAAVGGVGVLIEAVGPSAVLLGLGGLSVPFLVVLVLAQSWRNPSRQDE